MRLKVILIILSLICSLSIEAKSKRSRRNKKNKSKIAELSTAYFICAKKYTYKNENLIELPNQEDQKIILAIETKNNEQCKLVGGSKLLQLSKEGWSCIGRDPEEYFSCLTESAFKLAEFEGKKLTYLKYKNLSKHIGIIGYFGEEALKTCNEDRDHMIEAGVKDVTCYKR